MASILLGPSGPGTLVPMGNASRRLKVDGVVLGAEPVVLSNGATIEAAGLRLFYADARDLRTATEVMSVRAERAAGNHRAPLTPTASALGLVSQPTGVIAAIPNGALVIGRAPDSDLVIPTRDVSRRHALIKLTPAGYVIRDLSANGTFVNGQRINESHVLTMGDIIRIGGEELRFEADAAEPGGGSEAPESSAIEHSLLIVEPPTRPRSAVA